MAGRPKSTTAGNKKMPRKAEAALNKVMKENVELTQEQAEARRTQLKNLIGLGKERGYLTYA